MDLWLSFGSALTSGSCVCFSLSLLSALWVFPFYIGYYWISFARTLASSMAIWIFTVIF